MKNKKIGIAFLLMEAIGILFFSACKKDVTGPAGPQGPPGTAYTGSITGFVSLYDQYGTKQTTNIANINVSIDNTTKTSLTDNSGKYSFSNLSTGSYSLSITDSLYGADKVQNIALLTGQSNHDVKLSAIPTFSLTTVTAIDTIQASVNYVKVRGTIAADTKAREVVVFFGSSSTVSSVPANYVLSYSKAITANSTSFFILVPVSDLYGAGLTTGSTAYFSVYPAAVSFASTSTYEDLNTGKTVYNAIGTSPLTANAVIP
jgi:hypothetical protein